MFLFVVFESFWTLRSVAGYVKVCLRLLQHTIVRCLDALAHEMLEVNTWGFKGLLLVKFKISKSRDKYTMGQKKINALWGYQEGLTALGAANKMSLKLAAMNKKWNISKDNQNSFFSGFFSSLTFSLHKAIEEVEVHLTYRNTCPTFS